jgi:hypothetical protein
MMNSGINLALYIGPVIPLPAPRGVIEALTEVTVRAGSAEEDGFELKFNLSDNATLLQSVFLLSGGAMLPLVRVVIAVNVNGVLDVLIDGLLTQTSLAPDTGSAPSQLIVKGRDISHVMDGVDFSGLFPYPAMPLEARVALILAKYMMFGIIPMVIPTPSVDINNPLERIEQHWGTDLVYLRHMAEMVGYTFYIEPGPAVGTTIGYWGPLIRVGPTQKALNVDMDIETNVESISCTFDHDSAAMPIVAIENPFTRTPPIPIPVGLSKTARRPPPLGGRMNCGRTARAIL